MRQVLMALVLVAGCGAGADQANNAADDAVGSAVATAGLTGLYEGGSVRPNQLCIIDEGTGNASFGLVVWGANMHSCSGAGQAVRDGNRLTLTMTGDESCAIEASIEGGKVTLPATLPQGCAYYCGAQARMTGASFTRKGVTAEDAMKATDLVGEPLCGGH
ncbi:MAG TPA: hypothetical protein VNT77_10290 [Allosphingosinicella sp.]|nr:hypothetical protein [Allosphingosinicella sp.]